ncbi:putative receptor-like protein kinase At4g00960 [Mangifera indica]|uniref:putative receptor-like protein kinase At4g00960 n=1 Tax=Mangifera indica TaxID=29780 RepID=UPI001CFB8228|nr:putative receptor-like protein kinase At4g00960 [Mangifera indica]
MRIPQHAMALTILLRLLTFLSMGITLSNGQKCYDTGNFTANSTYGKNRNLIVSTLAANASTNGGFYNATIGQDANQVYASALCRGDSSPEACLSCVNSTSHDLITKCPNQNEAIEWEGCVVRYSNQPFFGVLQLDPMVAGYNTGDLNMNLTQFDQIWESLMDRVATKASMGSSKLKFATGEANLTLFQKIYSFMQCSPDLSRSNCDYCLRQSVSQYQTCCHGKQGGYVNRPNCVFRWDLYPFYDSIEAQSPSPSPPSPPQITIAPDKGGIAPVVVAIIVVSIIITMAVLDAFSYVLLRRTRKAKEKKRRKQELEDAADEIEPEESLQFDFSTIKAATDNFSIDNKLGQGGFGSVYKGRLPNGQEIAVKRLSRDSGQGDLEFKNEVLLMAKLHHRNLVRLLGFCLEDKERLLIYEFVPNSSLDNFIFDPTKRLSLDWEIRYKIIGGIARRILYLHEDSRLRIIHRDIKVSNILLDKDMTPKISDFGMAKLFEFDQTRGDTSKIVGTFGYMPPEYVHYGHFSVKSDVFSFGVLVLEIITGQKINSFCDEKEGEDLLTYAWRNWKEGTALNMIDPTLRGHFGGEIIRCIHIGLQCVQENEADRPTMTAVVLMLTSSSVSISVPSKPAFYMNTTVRRDDSRITLRGRSKINNVQFTVKEASIAELDPR